MVSPFDGLWKRYRDKLHTIGIVIDDNIPAYGTIINTFQGMYGEVPVTIEYHLGMINWPGWVEVCGIAGPFMFLDVGESYVAEIKVSIRILR